MQVLDALEQHCDCDDRKFEMMASSPFMQVLDALEQHCDCDDKVWNDDKQLKTKFKTFVLRDSRNNHEIEYDSQILVSSVNLICQDFQCVFRHE